jgi:hypothetical protein
MVCTKPKRIMHHTMRSKHKRTRLNWSGLGEGVEGGEGGGGELERLADLRTYARRAPSHVT